MLVNLKEILAPAREGKYAVGHFNTYTTLMARSVIQAAEELDSPVIIGIEERQLELCPLEVFASFAIPMAQRAKVPVAVHFDRGHSFDKCIKALHLGFTSIDCDCSELSFEENVASVSELVRVAHALDASVEGELGRVPVAANFTEVEKMCLTEPFEAGDYVARTGVDALAIAVGNVMGYYKKTPKVDFDRIAAISDATRLPLVLHGGSGLSDKAFRKAISNGISKINIFTDLNIAAGQGIMQATNSGYTLMSEIIPYELHSMRVQAAEKIRLFQNRKGDVLA
ncbi:MAG: class II fructose-bisphosphate aldolase [Lachnospiraceae bacterium]|nr:class II fructose-bisphosphate aldolase [Lachnospiraceae bacterium]